MGTEKMKRWKGYKSQEKEDQERIDNLVLVFGLYNRDPCILVANFFTINLTSTRTEDVRAQALIPSRNTLILRVRVWRCYCNVYTQVENTLIYIR